MEHLDRLRILIWPTLREDSPRRIPAFYHGVRIIALPEGVENWKTAVHCLVCLAMVYFHYFGQPAGSGGNSLRKKLSRPTR